jgi:hypothetical protein
LIAIVLAMAIPLVWPTIPPLVDLPGHMGRYEIQLNLANSPMLQGWYDFHWMLIGNLGVDLLVQMLAPVFGLEPTVKAIVLMTPVITAAGLLWIAHEVHGRVPPTAFLALPLAYGHPFHFGFVNYALSMALALLAFALWLRLVRLNKIGLRAVVFVPIGLLLWVCHIFGWAVLGVMAFSAEAVRAHDRGVGWFRALIEGGLHCLPLAPPVALMILWRTGGVSGQTVDWFNWKAKFLWFQTTLRDRWQLFDFASLAVLIIALVWAIRSKTVEFSRHLGATALFLLLVHLLLPRIVFGSAYADMRLTPFVIAIAIIAIRPRKGVPSRQLVPIAMIALAFFTVRMAGTTASLALHHQRHEMALQALDHIPRETRLISFVGRNCRMPYFSNRMEHLPAIALVRNHAFSNDQWVMAGAQLLTIRKSDAPGFVADPSQLVSHRKCPTELWGSLETSLARFPRAAFDMVWVIDPLGDVSVPGDLKPVWTNGLDTLYRIESVTALRVPAK